MPILLFAPLDSRLRPLVQQVTGSLGPDCEVRFLVGAVELRGYLERFQGDVLFLDMDLPSSELCLAEVARLRSDIQVVGAGAGEEPNVAGFETRFPQCYFPMMTYLPKPLSPEGLGQAFQRCMRQLARGVIEGLSLPSLLQMLNIERKTCTIRVLSGKREGFFYMQAGELINARFRRVEGLDAAVRLLAADSPRAEIQSQLHDSTRSIHARLEEILMEAMQFKDEDTDQRTAELAAQEEAGDDALPDSETGKWQFDPARDSAPPPRKKRVLLPVLGVCILLGIGVMAALPFRKASLRLQSVPSGAVLSLNGRRLGQTPMELTLPKPLRGTLRVEAEGYQALNHELRDGERELQLTLEPNPRPLPPVVAAVPAAEVPEPEPEPEAPTSDRVVRPHPKRRVAKPNTPPTRRPGRQGDVFDQLR